MIALALFAAMQVAPAPAPEPDIVIIGRRLSALSVIVGKDAQGSFTCSLTESSGSPTLDVQLCLTASKCVIKHAKDVTACINKRKPALLADLRASMAGGK